MIVKVYDQSYGPVSLSMSLIDYRCLRSLVHNILMMKNKAIASKLSTDLGEKVFMTLT